MEELEEVKERIKEMGKNIEALERVERKIREETWNEEKRMIAELLIGSALEVLRAEEAKEEEKKEEPQN